MTWSSQTRIKICCISSAEEASLAIRGGADAIGLVSAMPSGPGVIPEHRIAEIARQVPPGVGRFLLTSETDIGRIRAQVQQSGVDTLQLVDRHSRQDLEELRRRLPGITIIQVVHVTGPEVVEEVARVARLVDGLLLDSGNPSAAIKELGGTGRTHDWNLSRRIVDSVSLPVYLAGGLHPGNVGRAIHTAHPFGVDVCSGVRTNGKLDEKLLVAFVQEVRAADERARQEG
jgi:phosphoribosylanthranilate isomerase